MIWLPLLSAFAASDQVEPVIDVLVASNDKKLIATIEKVTRRNTTVSAYREQVDEKRFRVAEWGKSGLILLDRQLPMLTEIVEERELYSSMLKHADSQGILDLAKMAGSDRDAVEKRVRARLGSIEGDYKAAAGHMSQLTLTGPSGKSFEVSLFGDIEERRKIHAELEKSAPKRSGSEAGGTSSENNQVNSTLTRGEFGVHLLSYFTGRMSDGLQHLSKLVEAEMTDLKKQRDEVLLNLVQSMRETRGGLAAPVPFSQLPEDLKKSAREQFIAGFRAYGFASADEARVHLESSEVKVETMVTLTVFSSARGRGFLIEVVGRLPGG